MLQKILVILVGLVMSLIGAMSPSGMFAAKDASHDVLDASKSADATLATVKTTDSSAFAKLSVLWVDVDGKRVTEDAWGTGEIKEVKFKVGTKGLDGLALAVGEKLVPVHPTDVLTIRMFRGDFAYRGMTGASGTLQLQGTVKTALVSEGARTGKLQTSTGALAPASLQKADAPDPSGRVAYVLLNTGESLDTVNVQPGGSRVQTEDTLSAASDGVGNLLVQWVKIDGKAVREYTTGEGQLGLVEFSPVSSNDAGLLEFKGAPASTPEGQHVFVKDFVGEYLVYQVNGGLLRLRLDGYATSVTSGLGSGVPDAGGIDGPLAAFDIVPENPKTTDVLEFKDRSSDNGVVVFWKWTFGDGASAVLQDPTHRYVRPGVYNVTLTITDDDLHTIQTVRTIIVRNAEPVPDFDYAPHVVTTDSLVTFTDRSIDTDGSVVGWAWDFGDGVTSDARHPSHQYVTSGTKTVKLTVTDDLGALTKLTRSILVRNTPPVADFIFSTPDSKSLTPTLFTSTSLDADGAIVDWSWDFSDGHRANGAVVTHSFATSGIYIVTLTVTDNEGATGEFSRQVVILNTLPTANFTWSVHQDNSNRGNETIVFTSTSTDPDTTVVNGNELVEGGILLNQWDFGDGSDTIIVCAVEHTVGVIDFPGGCHNPNSADIISDIRNDTGGPSPTFNWAAPPPVTHKFPGPGLYNVTLYVTDDKGGSASITLGVHVNNTGPDARIDVDPGGEYHRNQVITFTDVTLDADGDAMILREWDLGDGFNITGGLAARSLTHTYPALGTYTVSLHVRDSHGADGYASVLLPIVNAPPKAWLNVSTTTPSVNQNMTFWGNATDDDSNGPFTFLWTFIDGTSTTQNVTRSFSLPTTLLPVSLRVEDPEGKPGNASINLQVLNALPQPDFTWAGPGLIPLEPTEGETVQFTDLSITANAYILNRDWQWGDGTPGDSLNHSAPTHVFTQCRGDPNVELYGYDVRLKVTDDQNTDMGSPTLPSTTKHVTVNCKPTAGFAIETQQPFQAGRPATFLDDSKDPETDAPNSGRIMLRHWDWGDNLSTDTTSGGEVQHTYYAPGTHVITLTVTDDHGAQSSTSRTVSVTDRRPVARWAIVPAGTHAQVGITTQFSAWLGTYDPDGNDTIVSFNWDFQESTFVGGQLDGWNVTHDFTVSGRFRVTLSVYDGILFNNPNDPGATQDIRVTAGHSADVTVRAFFPNGTEVDLSDPHIYVQIQLHAGNNVLLTHDKSYFNASGLGGYFRLDAGVWAAGDIAYVSLQDTRHMSAYATLSYTMEDQDGLTHFIELDFTIPVALHADLYVQDDPSQVTLYEVITHTRPTGPRGPIYTDLVKPFFGEGNVTFDGGSPAVGAGFVVQMHYINLTSSTPNVVPPVLGWCNVDSGSTDFLGHFTWQVQHDTGCFIGDGCIGSCIQNGVARFPPGEYEFRVIASFPGTDSVQGDRPATAYEDPTGIIAPLFLP